MSDSTLDADVIKRTQDTLGKFVKKPPLTEKLLKKPPFRFLFDVVGAVIRETGYFEGLYTPDELNIENISDREKKMQFLQKLIDVIKLATNEPLTVKPSKIVAGHEPEKTNELLQQMGIMIEKKLDWKTAVETVNNGGVPAKPKSKPKEKAKEAKEKKSTDKPSPKNPDTKKTSRDKPKAEIKEKAKSNDAAGKKPSKSHEPEKKDKKMKIKPSSKDSKDALKKASPEKPSKSIPERSPEGKKSETKDKSKELKKAPTEEKEIPPAVESPHVGPMQEVKRDTPAESGSPSAEFKRDKRRASKRAEEILLSAITEDSSNSENRRTSASRKSSAHSRKSSAEKVRLSAVDESSGKSPQEPIESLKTVVEEPSPVAAVTPVSKADSQPNTDPSTEVKRETTFVRENSNDSAVNPTRPRTSLRPPSARPASARPGAPRRRDKNIEIILQPNDQIKLSGINIKLETFKSDLEDDGENLVIIEDPNTTDPLLESRLSTEKVEADETLQQGHLVQQILETQKELVHGSPDIDQKLEKESDVSKPSTRQSSATQMDGLRDLIQNLTKSVNPLGKLMDFIPEDIDSMQLELTMWRDTYTQSSIELKKERSLTASVTEPMKNQLTTIEASIKEYQEMIDACRVKILQNAEKIQRLLTTQ